MVEIMLELFVPEISPARWQWVWNAWNLFWAFATTGMLAAWFGYLYKRRNGDGAKSGVFGRTLFQIGVAVIAEILLIAVSKYLQDADPAFPFYTQLYSVADFLDRFLYLENLLLKPFDGLPWCNIACRYAMICVGIFGTKIIFKGSTMISEKFYAYLESKFTTSDATAFVKKLWNLLKKTGLFGAVTIGSVAVFSADEYREEINKILSWLKDILSQITFLTHLPEEAATFSEMAQAFFVVIFSILIVAAYLLLIVAVVSVANVLWKHREDLMKRTKQWFQEIGYILFIVALVLFVVLFSVLLATKSDSFREAIALFVENSPQTVFVLLQHTVLILLGVGVVVLMCCTLIAVIMFGINFVKAWSQTVQVTTQDADKARQFLKMFGTTFLSGVVLAFFIFGYDPIRGWLVERFAYDADTYDIWWVMTQVCAALMSALAVVGMIILSFYLIILMGSTFVRYVVKAIKGPGSNAGEDNRRPKLWARVKAYGLSLGDTILRIFKGYQTENQKNAAVYVAACFASLASLTNTALGLYEFNIPLVLAVAMSFAVQLAMLIIGMKAGQGIAENIVSDVKQVGASLLFAVARKVAICGCYILAFVAAKYGIFIASNQTQLDWSLPSLFSAGKDTFIPILLIWCAALSFGYAVVKQILEILVLVVRGLKKRTGSSGKRRGGNQEEDRNSGLLLSDPRKIPARYYLIAYLLLMIVSTGFAFTNLFEGYAKQVQLHTRVFDQVYSETEKELDLQGKAVSVVGEFQQTKQEVLRQLGDDYAELVTRNAYNVSLLEAADALEGAQGRPYYYASDAKIHYAAQMNDFGSFYEALVSFINRDYDLIGEDLTIRVYEYSYRSGESLLYSTVALKISSEMYPEEVVIGQILDNFDGKKINVKERLITDATKYTILDELFAVYENYAKTITEFRLQKYSYIDYSKDKDLLEKYFKQHEDNEGTTEGGTPQQEGGTTDGGVSGETQNTDNDDLSVNDKLDAIRISLDRMEILDDVRRNVAELYFRVYSDAERHVPMIDLPRIIDLYLNQNEEAVLQVWENEADLPTETTAPTEGTEPSEETTASPEGTEPSEETTASPEGTELSEETTAPTEGTEPSEETTASPEGTELSEETTAPTEGTEPYEETTAPTEESETKDDEEDGQKEIGTSYDKEEAFWDLSAYVDRSLQVYSILNIADSVLDDAAEGEDQGKQELQGDNKVGENEENNTEQNDDSSDQNRSSSDKAYQVRKYRSYARGVASSSFQISFDALLKGGFGLNSTYIDSLGEESSRIDALYAANLVAIFILVICALVDFMAFFAGLLLFQSAFVLDIQRGSKLEKLGYVNFDATVTDYFMPVEEKGKTRTQQIALIYYLINGDCSKEFDTQLLTKLSGKVDLETFKTMLRNARAFLQAYGIAAGTADFHVWLVHFAKKNEIDFDEIQD